MLTIFWALFFGFSVLGPGIWAISWAAFGGQFPVSILWPDSGPGVATVSEMDGVAGGDAEPG